MGRLFAGCGRRSPDQRQRNGKYGAAPAVPPAANRDRSLMAVDHAADERQPEPATLEAARVGAAVEFFKHAR